MDKDNISVFLKALENATERVTEYRLFSASTAYDLDRQVCQALESGWRLYGNPIVTYSANGNYNHSQAVVR